MNDTLVKFYPQLTIAENINYYLYKFMMIVKDQIDKKLLILYADENVAHQERDIMNIIFKKYNIIQINTGIYLCVYQ
jgi:hypothetical protein